MSCEQATETKPWADEEFQGQKKAKRSCEILWRDIHKENIGMDQLYVTDPQWKMRWPL